MEKKISQYSRSNSISFYDWCMQNSEEWILDLWNNEVTGFSPKDVTASSSQKAFFNCSRNIHNGEWTVINNITGDKHFRNLCRQCLSFEQYCVDNDDEEWLDRWDYILNKKKPSEVRAFSNLSYWFKCPCNNPTHHSELKMLSNFIQQDGTRRCVQCDSFGTWAVNNVDEDFVSKYWSNKNTISPFEISYRQGAEYWFKCQNKDYHPDYKSSITNFVKGNRCPYCSGKKVAIEDSVGTLYPQILKIWSPKNKKSPYEYMQTSNKTVIFNCEKHGEYNVKLCNAYKNGFVCKYCEQEEISSILQRKVSSYFEECGYNVLHENNCNLHPINPLTGHILRYDNEILELKLICEVNGAQHYKVTNLAQQIAQQNNITPEEALRYQQFRDVYKMQYALLHGYYFLEIPYDYEKKDKYKLLIDKKIQEIKTINCQP